MDCSQPPGRRWRRIAMSRLSFQLSSGHRPILGGPLEAQQRFHVANEEFSFGRARRGGYKAAVGLDLDPSSYDRPPAAWKSRKIQVEVCLLPFEIHLQPPSERLGVWSGPEFGQHRVRQKGNLERRKGGFSRRSPFISTRPTANAG
jgi:hypothetical protein